MFFFHDNDLKPYNDHDQDNGVDHDDHEDGHVDLNFLSTELIQLNILIAFFNCH